MKTSPSVFFTTKQACDYLQCSRRTICRLKKQGALKTYPPNSVKLQRFWKEDIDNYMGINSNKDEITTENQKDDTDISSKGLFG